MVSTSKFWRRPPSLNRVLLFVVLPCVLLANVLCFVGRVPHVVRNAVEEARFFLQRRAGDDSWGPMQKAIATLKERPTPPLYQTIFFEKGIKFQYPLSSLLSVKAVESITGIERAQKALNLLSFLSVWLTAFLCGEILLSSARPAAGSRRQAITTMGLSTALVVLFYPVVKAYTLGQIQAWIGALVAGALYLALTERWTVAGALIGMACTIKPQLCLVIVWALARRRWNCAGSALAVVGLAMLVTLLLFGWHEQVEYLRVLRFISERGESFYPNHSVNGLLNRLFFNGNNLDWNDFTFPAPLKVVQRGTIVTSAVLTLAALFWRRREHAAAPLVDLCIAILTATVASPIAWEHHYGVLVGMYAATFPLFMRHRPLGKWTGPLLLGSFVLSGSFIPAVQRLAGSRFNVLQSYLLFAGLVFLVLMYALRHVIAASMTTPLPAAPIPREPIFEDALS